MLDRPATRGQPDPRGDPRAPAWATSRRTALQSAGPRRTTQPHVRLVPAPAGPPTARPPPEHLSGYRSCPATRPPPPGAARRSPARRSGCGVGSIMPRTRQAAAPAAPGPRAPRSPGGTPGAKSVLHQQRNVVHHDRVLRGLGHPLAGAARRSRMRDPVQRLRAASSANTLAASAARSSAPCSSRTSVAERGHDLRRVPRCRVRPPRARAGRRR